MGTEKGPVHPWQQLRMLRRVTQRREESESCQDAPRDANPESQSVHSQDAEAEGLGWTQSQSSGKSPGCGCPSVGPDGLEHNLLAVIPLIFDGVTQPVSHRVPGPCWSAVGGGVWGGGWDGDGA